MAEKENTSIISIVTVPIFFKIILFIIISITALIIWFSSLFIINGTDGWVLGNIAIPTLIAIILIFYMLFLSAIQLKYIFKNDCIEKINYKKEISYIYYNDILEARPKNTILSAISFAHLEIIFKSGDDTHVTNIYFLDNPDYYRSLIFGGLSNSDNGFIV